MTGCRIDSVAEGGSESVAVDGMLGTDLEIDVLDLTFSYGRMYLLDDGRDRIRLVEGAVD